MTNKPDVLTVLYQPLIYDMNGVTGSCQIVEFAINARPLSALLGVKRDLGCSECGLDIEQLSARSASSNQFGTGRVVLYGCHCGCDYCGVFSCRIVDRGKFIEWHDISFEDDSGAHLAGQNTVWPELRPIEKLVFDKEAYLQVIRAAYQRPQ